jgi:hypothetical protein
MTGPEIIYALRAGQTIVMRGRGTREEEATLSSLHARGFLYLDASEDGRVLIIRWKQRRRRYVRVRVIERTWYGVRVSYRLVEV